MTAILFILVVIFCYAISWIVTCGLIKLISLCFGFAFSWAIATGIWLVLVLLRSVFHVTVNNH